MSENNNNKRKVDTIDDALEFTEMCECGEPVKVGKTKKNGINYGREFKCCSLFRKAKTNGEDDKGAGCGLFEWISVENQPIFKKDLDDVFVPQLQLLSKLTQMENKIDAMMAMWKIPIPASQVPPRFLVEIPKPDLEEKNEVSKKKNDSPLSKSSNLKKQAKK